MSTFYKCPIDFMNITVTKKTPYLPPMQGIDSLKRTEQHQLIRLCQTMIC